MGAGAWRGAWSMEGGVAGWKGREADACSSVLVRDAWPDLILAVMPLTWLGIGLGSVVRVGVRVGVGVGVGVGLGLGLGLGLGSVVRVGVSGQGWGWG
jgi:hypothetical protein